MVHVFKNIQSHVERPPLAVTLHKEWGIRRFRKFQGNSYYRKSLILINASPKVYRFLLYLQPYFVPLRDKPLVPSFRKLIITSFLVMSSYNQFFSCHLKSQSKYLNFFNHFLYAKYKFAGLQSSFKFYCKFTCQETPNLSATQPNFWLKP